MSERETYNFISCLCSWVQRKRLWLAEIWNKICQVTTHFVKLPLSYPLCQITTELLFFFNYFLLFKEWNRNPRVCVFNFNSVLFFFPTININFVKYLWFFFLNRTNLPPSLYFFVGNLTYFLRSIYLFKSLQNCFWGYNFKNSKN